MSNHRQSDWTLWVVAVACALHATEEYLMGWLDWAPATLGIRLPASVFIVMNAVLVIIAFALAAAGRRRPVASLVIPAATLTNAVLFHILPTLLQRTPAPGIYTAVLLYLPFSSWAFVAAHRDGVPRDAIGKAIIGGVALGLGIVVAARAFSGAA